MGIIVTGFASECKTALCAKYTNVLSLEASDYQYLSKAGSIGCERTGRVDIELNPMFPRNYLTDIFKAFCGCQYDIVLVTCSPRLLESLSGFGLDVMCMYPACGCASEKVEKFDNFEHVRKYGYKVHTVSDDCTLESKLLELGYEVKDGKLIEGV